MLYIKESPNEWFPLITRYIYKNQPILLPLFLQDIAALRTEFPFGRVAWYQFL